jgi:hypothetical protein
VDGVWRRWDDRLYAGLVAAWVSFRAWLVVTRQLLLPPREPEPLQPAPKVLVSVGASSAVEEPVGEVLAPPEQPAPTSSWAARPSHSKVWLACVLLGEVQAGVMLRAVYEVVLRT